MTDHSEHSRLEELKEKVEEVIELLNRSNLPLIATENGESALPGSTQQDRQPLEISEKADQVSPV